jgi:serine/threonine-protein kinase RsbW
VSERLETSGIGGQVTLRPRPGGAALSAPFTERVEVELSQERTAPARARAELRHAVRGWLSEEDAATATLLVSELVTNAVIHPDWDPGGSVGLRITTYADRLRVEVTDSGPGFDVERLRRRPALTGGQGLLVVDGLASRWGIDRVRVDGELRFLVWFELDAGAET